MINPKINKRIFLRLLEAFLSNLSIQYPKSVEIATGIISKEYQKDFTDLSNNINKPIIEASIISMMGMNNIILAIVLGHPFSSLNKLKKDKIIIAEKIKIIAIGEMVFNTRIDNNKNRITEIIASSFPLSMSVIVNSAFYKLPI